MKFKKTKQCMFHTYNGNGEIGIQSNGDINDNAYDRCQNKTYDLFCDEHAANNGFYIIDSKYKPFKYNVRKSMIRNGGLGLYYKGDDILKPNDKLPIYFGKIVPFSYEKKHPEDGYILCGNKKICISANKVKESIGRYANDCNNEHNPKLRTLKNCNANFTSIVDTLRINSFDGEKNYTAYSVNITKPIKKNKEIYIDYGIGYWKDTNKMFNYNKRIRKIK